MVTLRCTAKLLSRLGRAPAPIPPVSTTRLGDWYANLLFVRPAHLVLCVSERTLLPVLVPARDLASFPTRLPSALGQLLGSLGVSAPTIAAELAAMEPAAVAKTANRQVLGTMNDFAWMLEGYLEDATSPLELALRLAKAPCRPIGMESPDRATIALFSKTA